MSDPGAPPPASDWQGGHPGHDFSGYISDQFFATRYQDETEEDDEIDEILNEIRTRPASPIRLPGPKPKTFREILLNVLRLMVAIAFMAVLLFYLLGMDPIEVFGDCVRWWQDFNFEEWWTERQNDPDVFAHGLWI